MPKLTDYEAWFWQAFTELGTERPSSMSGLTQIPLSAVEAWGRRNDLAPIEMSHLMRVIPAVDLHYVRAHNAKLAAESSK